MIVGSGLAGLGCASRLWRRHGIRSEIYEFNARHPADRRARALAVTSSGRSLANRAVVAVEACDADFFAALGNRIPAFTTALATLRHAAG